MTISYRAAFLPADANANGARTVLTRSEHAHFSDEELIFEAKSELFCAGIDADGIEGFEIVIGEWME